MEILCVDDAVFTRKLLARHLEAEGHVVHECASGDEAVLKIKERAFDLLITDLLMDGLSGLDLLSVAREEAPSMPVIVLTADMQTSTQAMCRERGAVAVYTKSMLYPDGKEFLEGLSELMGKIKP